MSDDLWRLWDVGLIAVLIGIIVFFVIPAIQVLDAYGAF